MKQTPRFITCLLMLAVLAGCVLPGNPGSQNELPPTITAVSVPPAGEPPTEAAPDVEQPPTVTPAAANENNATTGMVRVKLTAPAATNREQFTLTFSVNNRTRSPITGARAVLALPKLIDVIEVLDGGLKEGKALVWDLPEIPANNGRAEVRAVLQLDRTALGVEFEDYRIEAPGLDPSLVETAGSRFVYPGEVTMIQAVQGSGDISPHLGETLAVEGTVTGVFRELEGFFLFRYSGIIDGASMGLFIHAPESTDDLEVGINVRARGIVSEEDGQTTLVVSSPDDVQVIEKEHNMPAAEALTPPQDPEEALRYYESLEGMLVKVGKAVAVSPTTRYGEFVVVLEQLGVTRLFQGEENGYAIMVDDGSSGVYEDGAALPVRVRSGDQVRGLRGILAYTFGRFKVEPIQAFEVSDEIIVLPSIAPAGEGEISVMTWNVENLFDTSPPNPSDPPMPSPEEFALELGKVAATITAAGAPDVVALQEVENIEVLQAIAEQGALAAYAYQPVLEEGTDQRGIDVGYLVRSNRVEVVEVRQYSENQGVYTRPPLLLRVRAKSGGAEIALINNHFTSMSGGVEESEPRRVLQAQGNLSIVEELRDADPNAAVAVLGDLNAFYQSAPIDVLRNGGLTHALEKVAPDQRYTYIHEGESQVLDHLLVTGALWQRIVRVEILHINSDFPPPLPGDPSPQGKSDHDPVIVIFDSK